MQTGMRNFDTGISAARRCFGGWGGITHAKQEALSTFGSCLYCRFRRDCPGAGAGATADVRDHQGGTDNVYVFRYQGHQSMFVVTPAGVIVTDPISYGRPQAAKTYLEEIRKITKAPIKYLIYSHHHYDHIAGGKVFKDAGATVIAHRRAKERLAELKGLDVVVPDQVVDGKRTIKLGGTTLDLVYTGRNHSDSSIVMLLPKEKILFAVDFNSLGAVPSRLAVNDSYPTE